MSIRTLAIKSTESYRTFKWNARETAAITIPENVIHADLL
jgi:hypothetical protein